MPKNSRSHIEEYSRDADAPPKFNTKKQRRFYSHDEVASATGLSPKYIKKKASSGDYPEEVIKAGFTRYIKFEKGRKRSECGWLKD